MTDLLIAGIGWDPELRGALTVLVGIVVLCGSIWLILGTNSGFRLGGLLALSGFFGWMFIMGLSWWIYGIGYVGDAPTWEVDEVVFGELDQSASDDVQELSDTPPLLVEQLTASDPVASSLSGSQVPKSLSDVAGANQWLVDQVVSEDGAALLFVAGTDEVVGHVDQDGVFVAGEPNAAFVASELVDEAGNSVAVETRVVRFDTGDWSVIPGADPFRGEAQAAADAALVEYVSADLGGNTVALGTFDLGGKPERESSGVFDGVANKITNTLTFRHPPHYAVVQNAVVVPQEVEVGEPPPIPEPDYSQPVMSVVMTRDLGNLRLPPALVTIVSGLLLALTAWMLHDRDKQAEQRVLGEGST